MLFEPELPEKRARVRRENFARRSARIERQGDGDQAAHEVRIAIAAIGQNFFGAFARADAKFEPDLADAAADLVGLVMSRLGERLQRAAEFENIPIAIFPFVKEGEIAADGVKTGQRVALRTCVGPLYIGMTAPRASATLRKSDA